MWGKLLKFPAHPPYKPIRSTHEQRSETGASKRTKISCGSRSGVVRGRQGSSGGVRGRQESSGVVRSRQGSSGVVRGRQESSGVISDQGRQSRQESSAEIGQLLLPSLYTLIPKNFSPFPGLCFILLPFRGGWFAWLFRTNLGPESLFRVSRQPSCVWAPFWFGGYFQLVG